MDGGASFEVPVAYTPKFGAIAIGPEGEVYVAGVPAYEMGPFRVAKSTDAQDPAAVFSFPPMQL